MKNLTELEAILNELSNLLKKSRLYIQAGFVISRPGINK